MKLECEDGVKPEHYALVERARKAVASINPYFRMNLESGSCVPCEACCRIYLSPHSGNPMIDFDVREVGSTICGAFIGPQVPLSEEIFSGDQLNSLLRSQLETGFEEFREYASNPSK